MYVIKDNSSSRIYIGSTNDLKRRLEEHRKGEVFSTKGYSNFTLIYYEAYISEEDARIREKRLKQFAKAYQELKKRIKGSLKGVG